MRWRVLVVEQDRQICRYLARQPGFEVVGLAPSAHRAAAMIRPLRPDLLVLELGDGGLALLRGLRSAGAPVEAIVVTAAADAQVVRSAVQLGVVDCLVKPFRPDRLRQALALFRRRAAARPGTRLVQEEIDALTAVRANGRRWLPRDLDPERLDQVRDVLGATRRRLTASEVGLALGVTRTTARRYLEYLVTVGEAAVDETPRGPGRPSKSYAALELALAS